MEDPSILYVERKIRDEMKEIKGDSSYNTFIKLLLKRNDILKRLVNDERIREFLEKYYKELYAVTEYFSK